MEQTDKIIAEAKAKIEAMSGERGQAETDKKELVSTEAVQGSLATILQKTAAEGKELKDIAKDLTFLKGASDLQQDQGFKETYGKELGGQLIEDLKAEGVRSAIIATAKKQEAKNLRASAFYASMEPIFDTIGIKKPFGLIPMAITAVLLMAPYLVVAIAMFVINSINKIFTAISGFSKPAMWICTFLVVGSISAGVIVLVLWGLQAITGWELLKFLKI